MLAQNFKTPTDLNLTDAQFDALVKVLGILERCEVRHVRKRDGAWRGDGFNMTDVVSRNECGTVCCMLGLAEKVSGNGSLFVSTKGVLDELFGMGSGGDWLGGLNQHDMGHDDVTPAHAAIALRNFLTHGEPRWAEALSPA